MLPCATNSALGGGVHLAAFVQQHQQQGGFGQQLVFGTPPVFRAGCSSSFAQLARSATVRPAAAAACGLLVVASACCPPRPRSGRLQVCASRSKTRRSRRGSTGGDGDTGDDDLSIDWPFEGWHGFYYDGGDGKDGSGGGGGWHHNRDSSGGDAFQPAVYHGVWLWQLLCAASLVRSLYFLLFSETVVRVDAAAGAVDLPHAAMAC